MGSGVFAALAMVMIVLFVGSRQNSAIIFVVLAFFIGWLFDKVKRLEQAHEDLLYRIQQAKERGRRAKAEAAVNSPDAVEQPPQPEEVTPVTITAPPKPARAPEPMTPIAVPELNMEQRQVEQPFRAEDEYAISASELQLPAWWSYIFSTKHLITKIGIIILFFGIGFLINYAATHNYFPLWARFCAAIALGGAFIIVGWFLRHTRRTYSLLIQGGGCGIIYIALFVAYAHYHFMSGVLCFSLLAIVALFTSLLAYAQDAEPLLIFALTGGFLAPILVHEQLYHGVMLYGYLLLLNVLSLFFTWRKQWFSSMQLAFVFTAIISLYWQSLFYQTSDFYWLQAASVVLFLFYLASSVCYVLPKTPSLISFSTSLVFGPPILLFTQQYLLLNGNQHQIAMVSTLLALVYVALYAWLIGKEKMLKQAVIKECYLFIALSFLTIAVLLTLSLFWLGSVLAIESVGLVMCSYRFKRPWLAYFSWVVLALSFMKLVINYPMLHHLMPFFNQQFIAGVIISLAIFCHGYVLHKYQQAEGSLVFVGLALVLWLVLGFSQISQYPSVIGVYNAGFLFIIISTLLQVSSAAMLNWQDLGRYLFFTIFAVIFSFLYYASFQQYTLNGAGYIWLLAAATWLLTLYIFNKKYWRLSPWQHLTMVVVFTAVLSLQCYWWLIYGLGVGISWGYAVLAFIPLMVSLLLKHKCLAQSFVVKPSPEVYQELLPSGVAYYLIFWLVVILFIDRGLTTPLPYLPIANPIDMMSAAIIACGVYQTYRTTHNMIISRDQSLISYAVLSFLVFNASLLKTVAYWCGVPWSGILFARQSQSSLSVAWAILAFVLMVIAKRYQQRYVWLAGALVIALLVGKLFLIDLAQLATLTRVITFMVTGALLVLIGYLSPIPPKAS